MVDDVLKQQILLMFRARDFESMWFVCKATYENLGFDAGDREKVDEYKWIVQQLRKYMFSKQNQIIECGNLDDMIAIVDDLIGKADEYGDDRKHIAYNFIRDHWLFELRNHLVQLKLDNMISDESMFDDIEEE